MTRSLARFLILFFTWTLIPLAHAQQTAEQLPPARKIPGLTAEDRFPGGCVDCHINMPDRKQDERLSTLMARWKEKANPELLKKAQAVAPTLKLKGTHPSAGKALENIPNGCKPCHGKDSKMAPPLAALVHTIHLTGGDQNHFLTLFQGECTHCHKLDTATGQWSIPSGPEK